ncbi:MAG: DNA polymerase [Opitutaceae bacterium]|nr:DNA polymerase [Opitutaceae bacterium]
MESLCGVWVAPNGTVHLSLATAEGGRTTRTDSFRPFSWTKQPLPAELPEGITASELKGDGPFRWLVHAATLEAHAAWSDQARSDGRSLDTLRPLESQYLLQTRQRLFRDVPFTRLRRCQLDIETGSEDGSFSDAAKPGDRVLAIGLQCGDRVRTLVLAEPTDTAERTLLEQLNHVIAEEDPDVIEGHNLFKFDLDYLKQRCRRHKVACAWGRFGQKAVWRNSRFKVAERQIDFPRCDLPGRTVVDTYLLVQLYDITARELPSYGLKDVAVAFGITSEDAAESGERTYIAGPALQAAFEHERERFLRYLADDLRETRAIADRLLPTYFEQARTFPLLFQEATLRGTTTKIDLLFLEEYYHARQACPEPPEILPFEGGYTRSFQEGVFRQVLHFDVASLYPSLLLAMGRNPVTDSLGVFIPLLTQLRTYRLTFKQLARTAPTEEERAEANARQASFKILINSFYGYLGFSGARFGDGDLASEVTRRGRELLQALIDAFGAAGCTVLEADTDGIYLSSAEYFEQPETLLARVAPVLPSGIELEYDGRYEAMFCYKAKNYALYDGRRVVLKGSALRSRGMEPFLRALSDHLIHFLLGVRSDSPVAALADLRSRISARTLPVTELAKTENLGQSADAYERFIAGGGKPRRASAEAALQLTPRPAMGDRVTYYLTAKIKGKASDWQRARPVSLFDPVAAPYDADGYLKRIDDWLERYGAFLGIKPAPSGEQDELVLG